MVPSPGFQSRFFVLANENRTQDAGHALLRQGRNPKVRKNSGVIVPAAGSTRTGLSFSYGSATDDNGGKLYDVKGESAAVSGGQAVTDVTPNCTVTNKQ